MKNEKILRRIKNLLDMAGDSANANEAMIAAKRARSLMDKYQVKKEDLLNGDASNFGESTGKHQQKVRHVWISRLSACIAALNDCQSIITRKRKGGSTQVSFVFRGFKSDVIVAKYMLDYLIEACNRILSSSKVKGRSGMNFFRIGFVEGVEIQVYKIIAERKSEIKTGNGKSLIIEKMKIVNAYFNEPMATLKTNSRSPNVSEILAFTKGRNAGKNISLDKQIDTEECVSLL